MAFSSDVDTGARVKKNAPEQRQEPGFEPAKAGKALILLRDLGVLYHFGELRDVSL